MKEKKLWKVWQKSGSKEECCAAKFRAKSVINFALKNAQIQKLSNLHVSDNKIAIFQLSGKLKGDKQYINGEKFVKKDVFIAFSDADKLTAWKDHYNVCMYVFHYLESIK